MSHEQSNKNLIECLEKIVYSWSLKNKKIIIGIDGASGIGKTTIAQNIALKNNNITHFNLDIFLHPNHNRIEKLRNAKDKFSIYENNWYDLKKILDIANIFKKTSNKKYKIEYQNSLTKKSKIIHLDFSNNILLIDGIFLNNTKMFPDVFDKIIYLSMNKETLSKRRIIRHQKKYPDVHIKKQMWIIKSFEEGWKQYMKKYKPHKNSDALITINVT